MRKVYILPNLFTSASIVLGVLAILIIIDSGSVVRASWFIGIAAIFDALDGKIARLTGTESLFGLNYDSLADITSFGLAPALIIYQAMEHFDTRLSHSVVAFYVLCGALRLARYNVQAKKEEKSVFMGLPIPGAAVIVLTFNLFAHELDWHFLYTISPLIIIAASYLMVSNIHYPGLKSISFHQKRPFQFLVLVIIFFALIVGLYEHYKLIFFPLAFLYMIFFWTKALYRRYLSRHQKKEASIKSKK